METVASDDPELPSPPRLSYVVGRLDRALREQLDGRLAPFGMSLPQYTAMSVLRGNAGLSNAQLARRSYVTPQTMIEVTKALERAGYVHRRQSPTHGRVLETHLTARGITQLALCDAMVDQLEDEMLAEVPAEHRALLVEHVQSCVRALHGGLDARRPSTRQTGARLEAQGRPT